MARVFISGSSTGLGLMAGQLLVEQGHRVVLRARNGKRADDARRHDGGRTDDVAQSRNGLSIWQVVNGRPICPEQAPCFSNCGQT